MGASDYINAVYMDSYTRKRRYIAAQTPFPETVVDFVSLVVQEQCSCIVSLDDDTTIDNTVCVYLPAANQVITHAGINIACVSYESTPQHTLRTLKIKYQGLNGPEETTICHYQFPSWKNSMPVPEDPSRFSTFVKDVQKTADESANSGPIIIHCLNGAGRSGLFCAVSVLIQKMDIENEASVVSTVRQMKNRRTGAIPNKEQYLFCHQSLCASLQSYDVYIRTYCKQPNY